MPATNPTTSRSPTPAGLLNNNLLQLPEFLVYKFTNSTPVEYGQLDSDDQEIVLRCPVCHCLITNQTNFCAVLSFVF